MNPLENTLCDDTIACETEFGPTAEEDGFGLGELRKLGLKPTDVLILHVPNKSIDLTTRAEGITQVLHERMGWNGLLIILGPGEDLIRMPLSEARALYTALGRKLDAIDLSEEDNDGNHQTE